MTDLTTLIERVEAASGADRELDCLIWCEVNAIEPEWQGNCLVAGIHGIVGWIDPGKHDRNFSCTAATTGPASVPAYSASLDAAMLLVPEGWKLHFLQDTEFDNPEARHWSVSLRPRHGRWDGTPQGAEVQAFAATPALALLAACLKARAK